MSQNAHKIFYRVAILLAFIGLADSVWLLYLHFEGATSSLCSISEVISCSVLNEKSYSEWLGIPIPYFSLIFYMALLYLLDYFRRNSDADEKECYAGIQLFAFIGVFTTLYMAFVSFFILKKFCPFCSVLYFVNIALFFLAFVWPKKHELFGFLTSLPLKKYFSDGLFYMFLLATVGLLFLSHNQLGQVNSSVSSSIKEIAGEETRALGSQNAEIHLVEYSDFECPACQKAADTFKDLVYKSSNRIKLSYKFYPLDAECNSSIPQGRGHQNACAAAYAAYCAGEQGQFWAYHDYVFVNQQYLDGSRLLEFAKRLTLNITDFKSCLNSPRAKKQVLQDIEEGKRLNLRGTPTLFINGREYDGRMDYESIKSAIDKL